MKRIPFLYPYIYLALVVILALAFDMIMRIKNNEGFMGIGKYIRPHVRKARIVAENKLGDYGRYIKNFLRKNI